MQSSNLSVTKIFNFNLVCVINYIHIYIFILTHIMDFEIIIHYEGSQIKSSNNIEKYVGGDSDSFDVLKNIKNKEFLRMLYNQLEINPVEFTIKMRSIYKECMNLSMAPSKWVDIKNDKGLIFFFTINTKHFATLEGFTPMFINLE